MLHLSCPLTGGCWQRIPCFVVPAQVTLSGLCFLQKLPLSVVTFAIAVHCSPVFSLPSHCLYSFLLVWADTLKEAIASIDNKMNFFIQVFIIRKGGYLAALVDFIALMWFIALVRALLRVLDAGVM
jgi:hypothetical protein